MIMMIASGEDVIASDHIGVQVQEKTGTECSIYVFVPRATGRYHTHPTTPHRTPISHPTTKP